MLKALGRKTQAGNLKKHVWDWHGRRGLGSCLQSSKVYETCSENALYLFTSREKKETFKSHTERILFTGAERGQHHGPGYPEMRTDFHQHPGRVPGVGEEGAPGGYPESRPP